MLPLVLAGLGIASLGVYAKQHMTSFGAEEQASTDLHDALFVHTMDKVKDPVQIRAMGAAFKSAGKHEQGDALLKRAALRETPRSVHKARKEVFKQYAKSTDPAKIRLIAASFDAEGCTGAARTLRQIADGLVKTPALSS
jgi:hypothetical protein